MHSQAFPLTLDRPSRLVRIFLGSNGKDQRTNIYHTGLCFPQLFLLIQLVQPAFMWGSDFAMILYGSTAHDSGVGALVPTLLADTKGKQQKCSNSLIGKAGVRLAFHLLDIAGMPGLAQGNLLLPWSNAEAEDFFSSLIIHALSYVMFSLKKHSWLQLSEFRNSVSDNPYSATAHSCSYCWLISFWFTEASLEHGAVPLQMQWITSVRTRTKQLTVFTVSSLRVRRQSDFFACVVLDVCVSRVGAPQGYPTCSERTKWLGNVLGTTACFQTVVFSRAALGPLFSFCSGQDGGKVSGWWAWMDALLTDPQAGQLSCKDHTKHWKFCCTIFCLKV